MPTHETCPHTPSRHGTLPGRFVDHLLNGETPDAAEERVLCARCGAEIAHPAAYVHRGARVACVCGASAAGALGWLLLRLLMAAGWPFLPMLLLSGGALALLSLLIDRSVTAFVLAAFPWEEIRCPAEDVPLHRSAAAEERADLHRKRWLRLFLSAMEVCTVLLVGKAGGLFALVFSGALVLLALTNRFPRAVLLPSLATLAVFAAAMLLPLPGMAVALMNLAAMTANAVMMEVYAP